jgi:hypothetical protein
MTNDHLEESHEKRDSYPFLCIGIVVLSVLALAGLPKQAGAGEKNEKKSEFNLVRSPGLNTSPNCVPDAEGDATTQQKGPVEILKECEASKFGVLEEMDERVHYLTPEKTAEQELLRHQARCVSADDPHLRE